MLPDRIGAVRLAAVTGVTVRAASHLIAFGMAGPVEMHGTRRTVATAHADRLAQAPDLRLGSVATVIRPGLPTRSGDSWRSWIGFHAAWPETRIRDAVRGDWICDPFSVIEAPAILLIVTVEWVAASFVVAGIDSRVWDEQSQRYRYRFRLGKRADIPLASRMRGLRPGWVLRTRMPV